MNEKYTFKRIHLFLCLYKALKKGGNAVDAAIASTLCIGVIDTFATGNTIDHLH
jgi:hypothetical protein